LLGRSLIAGDGGAELAAAGAPHSGNCKGDAFADEKDAPSLLQSGSASLIGLERNRIATRVGQKTLSGKTDFVR
jgi:hypothetical protein